MSNSLDFVFFQCLVAAAGLVFLLVRKQTAYIGISLLFIFSVASASLSAFVFGRLFGLREQWITTYHEQVFAYSGWMLLGMVAAMWLAWLPRKRRAAPVNPGKIREESFPWLTPNFIYFTIGLCGVATLLLPLVLHQVATVGTAVNLLASWLKLGAILAIVLFRKHGSLKQLLIAFLLFVPAALINALRSGFTPFSLDVLIPIILVMAFFDRVTAWSFLKCFVLVFPCMYLMFAWMASRNVIRSGDLDQLPISERASRFADVFVYELQHIEVTPYDIQNLLFERIDMSDLLAQEVGFEDSPSGEDQFRYGGTYADGAYALIPRALWTDKPMVAGYADFVSAYTGSYRSDTTAVGVPEQFELYANGGPPFVIVGMFILTYLCARLERFIAVSRRPLHILMPSIMFLMPFANGIEQLMLVLATAVAGAASSFLVARAVELFYPKFLPEFQARREPHRRPPRWIPAT